jgi:hypothetical protein
MTFLVHIFITANTFPIEHFHIETYIFTFTVETFHISSPFSYSQEFSFTKWPRILSQNRFETSCPNVSPQVFPTNINFH